MTPSSMDSFHTAPSVVDDEDLSDGEIDALLARATLRLKEKAKGKQLIEQPEGQRLTFPKLDAGKLDKPYVDTSGDIAKLDDSRILDGKYRKLADGIRKVEDPVTAKKAGAEKKKATAGEQWYNLPKTNLTPELKRDLQLLKMRNVLDPHRHYKKDGGKMKAPEYSQVGTIVEGPTEFFTGRVENKKRKRTLVEEVLEGERETGRFKNKYSDVQAKKTSGKKAFYKALKEERRGGVKKGGAG
ncbi:related to FCF2 Essential nucleolar involved in the early steps of 35S rRNA processing [Lecanosticta acicola]|uniref:Related to FCF2 Essential nucleolar involved in the early steps of 35S rRNA processing n=1 Tax=Lecanosticta acicola TaxID=111012 RepID=A0AAI9EEI3_9PEZI|nr:related to FCF2 Essential nucleolar involved in the early steps of 35S rRNA processing [Lecanosticta acicola]